MLESFFAKLAGKFLSKKLDLQEGPMDNSKKWYQSKTIWAGVVSGIVVAYNAIAPQVHLPAVPEFVYALLGALGVYSRVTATTEIEK